MRVKYKMLWFALDLHHRQRYFSICGCKRTVMKRGVKYPAEVRRQKRVCGIVSTPIPVRAKTIRFDLPDPASCRMETASYPFFADRGEFDE